MASALKAAMEAKPWSATRAWTIDRTAPVSSPKLRKQSVASALAPGNSSSKPGGTRTMGSGLDSFATVVRILITYGGGSNGITKQRRIRAAGLRRDDQGRHPLDP